MGHDLPPGEDVGEGDKSLVTGEGAHVSLWAAAQAINLNIGRVLGWNHKPIKCVKMNHWWRKFSQDPGHYRLGLHHAL